MKPNQIIILCPANAETGGVEDLHQLYGALQAAGENVAMAFVHNSAINDCSPWQPAPFLGRNEVRARYLQYGQFFQVLDIPDESGIVVIAPEIYQRALLPLKHALPCVWCLAAFPLVPQWKDRRIVPIAQSQYAVELFGQQGFVAPIPIVMLTDYLTPQIIPATAPTVDGRENAVLYFGGRGADAAEPMLQGLPSKRIFGMDASGLSDVFQKHRYFAYPARQPGMDKTPREAAVNGCVVWILKEGAGGVMEDAPLPDFFRCSTVVEMKEKVTWAMTIAPDTYADLFHVQAVYREWIRGAEGRFRDCVDTLRGVLAEHA